MGAAARLLGQAGHRRPVQAGAADGGRVDVLGSDLQIRRGGLAVEVQREVVRRKDLAEGDGRCVRLVDDDESIVDTEANELTGDIPAEGIVADAGDQGRCAPEACCGNGDVRCASTEELAEGLDELEADAGLQRVDVDAAAPDGEDVEGRGVRIG